MLEDHPGRSHPVFGRNAVLPGQYDRVRRRPFTPAATSRRASQRGATSGYSVTLIVLGTEEPVRQVHVRRAEVVMPPGTTLSPGVATGLQAGTHAQFGVVFPLTFVANAFVPAGTLPGVLQTVAEWNAVSALAAGLRTLFGNPTATPHDAAWPRSIPWPARSCGARRCWR